MSGDHDDRRHVTNACDLCRSKKIKCDGTQPCQHCISRVVECVYSERKKRGRHVVRKEGEDGKRVQRKRSRAASVHEKPSQDAEGMALVEKKKIPRTENMVNTYNRLNVLDIYFEKCAPYAGISLMFDQEALKMPANKAQMVQLNVALATASLCLDKNELAMQLMQRARLIAGEIFDEVSVDSLLAFGMLTDIFLGRDPRRASIYSKLAMSIGNVLHEKRIIGDSSQPLRYGYVASYIAGLDEARSMKLPLVDLQAAVEDSEEFGLIMSQCWFGLRLSMLALVESFHWHFDAKYREMHPEDDAETYKELMLNRACLESLSPATHSMNDIFSVLGILNTALCASAATISDYQFQYWRFKLLAGYAMVHFKAGRMEEASVTLRLVITKAKSLDFRYFPALSSSLLGTLAEICYQLRSPNEMMVFIELLRVMGLNHPIAEKAVPVFEAMYEDLETAIENDTPLPNLEPQDSSCGAGRVVSTMCSEAAEGASEESGRPSISTLEEYDDVVESPELEVYPDEGQNDFFMVPELLDQALPAHEDLRYTPLLASTSS